ncbi:SDR family NAD(P)-dependent oxidoreductase [Haloechinothrix sp. YIM 98757]|uniref:SDR family NAD(P)-dependent oxidoreductase n=1 Tax=Haloechinothrix aidingensis TaxID=2752311 RepID=A0A838AB91_9PSEU|nr:SDR family NAD(P)-dependent oxidoreductase [Haloechinothrix aidingensis]MBA0126522.1 SDR family NAD(P)-dependent oxidoreductase [Haloechinothrix aidingensis]
MNLAGRTLLMSGGSRGVGLAIAVAAARHGANLILLAKTDTPDPRLSGTIHTAAAEIEAAGGSALAVVGDVRDEASVQRAIEHGIAANCLWPETYIATDAVKNILGGDAATDRSRTHQIVADAATTILQQPARECTGNTYLDVEVLRDAGTTDLTPYGGTRDLEYDIFVDPPR